MRPFEIELSPSVDVEQRVARERRQGEDGEPRVEEARRLFDFEGPSAKLKACVVVAKETPFELDALRGELSRRRFEGRKRLSEVVQRASLSEEVTPLFVASCRCEALV